MNKNLLILVLIIAVLIVLGAVVFSKKSDTSSMMEKDGTMMAEDKVVDEAMMEGNDSTKAEDQMMEKDGTMMDKSGSYEAYSEDKLAKASTGDVVLFFRASWCPSCRAVDADIKANMKNIPTGLTILDVNYDDSTSLKQKYGVTYQHTFVQVDADGNLIKKWQGSPTLSALVTQVN